MMGEETINLIDLNGSNAYYSLGAAWVAPNDFDINLKAVLPAASTTYALFGQAASTANYFKILSTGYASISIDSSVVTSTVLATKGLKLRRYGVRLIGNDFIFTESGIVIDTVTDAVAAAKTLTLDVFAQSNNTQFFDGIFSKPNLIDITTSSNSLPFGLSNLTGNTEIINGVTLTYQNIAETIDVRDIYTLTNEGFTGSELVTNGDFAIDSDWSKGAGWTISGGSANQDGSAAPNADIAQNNTMLSGNTYKLSLVISNFELGVGGNGLFNTFTGSVVNFDGTSNGRKAAIITPTVTTTLITARNNVVGSIGSVSLRRLIEVAP
ncbi:MAG: hypothetical protein ACI9HU_000246 [Colwellia sp.]|jgi:hypothetical protein